VIAMAHIPTTGAFWPSVIERSANSKEQWDLPSRMLHERIIFLNGVVDDVSSASICMQLLYLDSIKKSTEISFYINSPGGVVTSGLAIYDTMQFISSPVTTLCMGQAASMGSLLLSAGAKGQRFALPNARIMVHQPSGGFQGQATDILIHAEEIRANKLRLNQIYVKHTGQDLETVEKALDRDNFMTAEAACTFGLIDQVVEKMPDGPDNRK
jgi:ATP-dependent Clp protease, protease subunit